MEVSEKRHLIRLHQRASRHLREYRKLSGEAGYIAQTKAVRHLKKAETLHCKVADQLKELLVRAPG